MRLVYRVSFLGGWVVGWISVSIVLGGCAAGGRVCGTYEGVSVCVDVPAAAAAAGVK